MDKLTKEQLEEIKAWMPSKKEQAEELFNDNIYKAHARVIKGKLEELQADIQELYRYVDEKIK